MRKSPAPAHKMMVMQCWLPATFPLVDYAHEVDGEWVALDSGKTVAQLNESREYADPVKLVSLAYGNRLCRAALQAAEAEAQRELALPASYHAARARRALRTKLAIA